MSLTLDEMWQAVLTRDVQQDGRFYTGVHSTGIYCRPSCKSRLPLRKNVRFYTTPEAAEQAGLRACKRCHPRQQLYDPTRALAQQARALIDAQPDVRLTLDDLAQALHASPFYLQRVFKAEYGVSPAAYGRSLRVQQLKQSLRQQSNVTHAIYEAGYGSSSRAYAHSDALGMTPGRYRKGGADEIITYAVFSSYLGCVMLAATERGVCSVKLGDSGAPLVDALRDEFHAATLIEDVDALHHYIQPLRQYLDGQQTTLNLPLDVHGTPFQHQVWQALQRIPYGERRTYQQIAEDIHQPGAVRAVGSACGANRTAVLIPCHRVVRSDGEMGGYEWGIQRKQALLAQEARLAEAPRILQSLPVEE